MEKVSQVQGLPSITLSGVLVTYRRPGVLRSTWDRLASQTRPLDRLVIVDNGSDAEIEHWLSREVGSAVSYADPGENVGPAGGYAVGLRLLLSDADDDDWVVLLDDDDPPFFDDAFENIEKFISEISHVDSTVGGVGISGGRFDLNRGRVRRVGDEEIAGPVSVDHVTGGGLPAYRVAAIRAVGLPLEELFFGFEELEYGLRLTSAGYHLYADGEEWRRRKMVKRDQGLLPPEEISVSRSEKTSLKVDEPTWRRYYSLRNLVFILRRYDRQWAAARVALGRGLAKPLLNLVLTPGLAWRSLVLNTRAIRDGWAGRMGRTVEPGQKSAAGE